VEKGPANSRLTRPAREKKSYLAQKEARKRNQRGRPPPGKKEGGVKMPAKKGATLHFKEEVTGEGGGSIPRGRKRI